MRIVIKEDADDANYSQDEFVQNSPLIVQEQPKISDTSCKELESEPGTAKIKVDRSLKEQSKEKTDRTEVVDK